MQSVFQEVTTFLEAGEMLEYEDILDSEAYDDPLCPVCLLLGLCSFLCRY